MKWRAVGLGVFLARFVVVWLTGSGFTVAGQRFDRAGHRVGGEFMVTL